MAAGCHRLAVDATDERRCPGEGIRPPPAAFLSLFLVLTPFPAPSLFLWPKRAETLASAAARPCRSKAPQPLPTCREASPLGAEALRQRNRPRVVGDAAGDRFFSAGAQAPSPPIRHRLPSSDQTDSTGALRVSRCPGYLRFPSSLRRR
jgi:hypothetical protein